MVYILDQIFNAQKGSRDEKVENFKSLFAEEDNVAVKAALAKAKQVEEMERLKSKHEQELEARAPQFLHLEEELRQSPRSLPRLSIHPVE